MVLSQVTSYHDITICFGSGVDIEKSNLRVTILEVLEAYETLNLVWMALEFGFE
jgi:hypothetical protein